MNPSGHTSATSGPAEASDAMLRLFEAVRFAAEKHRDDRRKGAIAAPYINHPIMVAEQLAATGLGHDVELLMAALLHDVVEDTDATPEELRLKFGERVCAIVLEVTDNMELRRDERKEQVVRHIASKSREARLVKLSDTIANTHDIIHHPPPWKRERKEEYLRWAERVVNRLRGVHEELESLFDDLLAEARESL